jgi:propionyl-CoA carboxylase beta chain
LGECIEEDAYETYWKWSREKADAFAAARSWTAQIVDEILLPKDTRKRIVQALGILENKKETLPPRKKQHGSSPT